MILFENVLLKRDGLLFSMTSAGEHESGQTRLLGLTMRAPGRFGMTALDTKNRSAGAAYGKNTREELLQDVEFMLNWARDRFKTENLFLYGHSMGGCVSLQFPCIGRDTLKVKQHLRGVVATSPLIRLTHPEAGWKLTAGHVASFVFPWLTIPAPVNAKVSKAHQWSYCQTHM